MKKKLTLEKLKVKSFSTSMITIENLETVKGGHTGGNCETMDNGCDIPTDVNCSCDGGCVLEFA